MIAKNEEKNIAKCLESVKNFVDEIIVVLDKESTDKTREIAKSFDAKIYDFIWQNDFSAARNFSLEKAKGDWILVLDADETISNDDIKKLRELIERNKADAYNLTKRDYTNNILIKGFVSSKDDTYEESKKYLGWVEHKIVRLFRRGYKFRNNLHELVEPDIIEKKGKIVNVPFVIHHYGNVLGKNIEEKVRRYIKIAEEKIKQNPYDFGPYHDQGNNYLYLKENEKAVKMFEKALSLNPNAWNIYADLALAYNRIGEKELALKNATLAAEHDDFNGLMLAGILLLDKDVDRALKLFHRALGINDKNPLLWEQIAKGFVKKNLFGRAIIAYNTANTLFPKADNYIECGFLLIKRAMYDNALDYFDKAIELENSAKAFYGKGICYLGIGDNEKAISCFKTSLEIKETIACLDALSKIYITQRKFEEAK